ncbi:MAG: hypothetical protein EOM67_14390 [Spirochaetia bacterium]|nr:hypothetical protein [Spirochaetia bacterium]
MPGDTKLYSGVSSAESSYNGSETGRHWVRPQELTYKPLDIVDYETKVTISKDSIEEAVIFGYPPTGMKASPFVIQAISEAIIKSGADGFLLSTYKIKRIYNYAEDSAVVTIHGRPLKLVNLGEVDQERADRERFITQIVLEEDSGKGITRTITTTTPVVIESFKGFDSLSNSEVSKSNSIISAPKKTSASILGKALLWAGGIVGSILVVGSLVSSASSM